MLDNCCIKFYPNICQQKPCNYMKTNDKDIIFFIKWAIDQMRIILNVSNNLEYGIIWLITQHQLLLWKLSTIKYLITPSVFKEFWACRFTKSLRFRRSLFELNHLIVVCSWTYIAKFSKIRRVIFRQRRRFWLYVISILHFYMVV